MLIRCLYVYDNDNGFNIVIDVQVYRIISPATLSVNFIQVPSSGSLPSLLLPCHTDCGCYVISEPSLNLHVYTCGDVF